MKTMQDELLEAREEFAKACTMASNYYQMEKERIINKYAKLKEKKE